MTLNREVEIKLRVLEIDKLRRKLDQLGAVSSGRLFESNTIYDTPQSSFRKSGRLLRLRTETSAPVRGSRITAVAAQSEAVSALLTYKTPIPRRGRAKTPRRYKEKGEFETHVEKPDVLTAILEGIGLRPGFCYEKYRTAYRLPALSSLALDLDETPAGVFLELEGPRSQIDSAAKLLGYSHKDYLTVTYWDIYRDDCRRRGVPVRNMIFKR